MTDVTRRGFVAGLAAGVVSTSVSSNVSAARADDKDTFSFLLLGDTHFDRTEHHDFDWMKKHFAKDISQVKNYCRHTQEKLPKLLAAAKARAGQAASKTAFALHVGDLVEGICGNRKLATRHCEEGWDFMKRGLPDFPLLMTKGNHDVTGPGSVEAYRDVLMARTAKELGRRTLGRTSYYFKRGKNLFAVFDAYDRQAIDWLEDVIRKNSFRRLFVLLHLPVVPYNARANWRVYDHKRQEARRRRLVNLLGRHRAIVLCGHLHKYSLLVRRCETGKFVQLAISSVVKDAPRARQTMLKSVADYGPRLTDLEPRFSPDTYEARRQLLTNEKPNIRHFEYGLNSGFALVSVDGDDVRAEFVNSAGASWKSVSLTKLLS